MPTDPGPQYNLGQEDEAMKQETNREIQWSFELACTTSVAALNGLYMINSLTLDRSFGDVQMAIRTAAIGHIDGKGTTRISTSWREVLT